MNLKEYKKKYKITTYKFAKELGIPLSTFYRWMSGHSKPRPAYAVYICKMTNGEITLKDLGLV